jgi:hypothetical protein
MSRYLELERTHVRCYGPGEALATDVTLFAFPVSS